jgi:hypothetical protein
MAKEWILNNAMNRFQFNFKRNVGATSESIRKCAPRDVEQWRNYYYSNVKKESEIEELGRRLYVKITEVIQSEVSSITEQDCIDYMKQMVIERTYDGYTTEISTIYGQLKNFLNIDIKPAPDEWDRKYNVDFFIEINNKCIGIQIKPVNNAQLSEIFKERGLQSKSHQEFSSKYGGDVFYVYSQKVDGRKQIVNKEVIDAIKGEMNRLSTLS